MAVTMHYVNVGFFLIGANGQIIRKDDKSVTVGQVAKGSRHEHRVIPSDDVPNSANYPTVKAYLTAEAANDFVLYHMDQTQIITYDAGEVNAAT